MEMSYFELIDYSDFGGTKVLKTLETAPTIEAANIARNRLNDGNRVIKIIKKFDFKWRDSDYITDKKEF